MLRQGLHRQHVLITVAICAACDATLIVAGVAGLGTVISASRTLTVIATVGGVAFLGWYGLRSFRSALRPRALTEGRDPGSARRRATALTALALSVLNPHVYLDTVVLLGSVGAAYQSEGRMWFATGAVLASLGWFLGLGYGATLLSGLFRDPRTWRVLDVLIGCVMWTVAVLLLV